MSTDSPSATSFVQARRFTKGPRTKGAVGLLVIHATAGKEVAGGARGVARWFADPNTRDASAHYVVDNAETVQCVREADVAWGAAHANHQGIHVEHVGLASQTPAQWMDAYSSAELTRSTVLAADICKRNNIPPVWLMPGDLLAGKRGITSHLNVDHAWPSTGHRDPGPGFPALVYCANVAAAMSASVRELLLLPEGRIVAWTGAMSDGARIVSHIQSIKTVEFYMTRGYVQHPFNGTVIVTSEVP